MTFQKEEIVDFLNRQLPKERLSRAALYGPHRDDFMFTTDGRLIKEFYSRGVCRTISYFFQLSQAQITKNKTDLPMLLLLDEPFSEIYRDLKFDLYLFDWDIFRYKSNTHQLF